MRDIFARRQLPARRATPPVLDDEREELSDVPLTPREGWTSLVSLTVMLLAVGVAIDDSRWAGFIGATSASQTGFLPVAAVLAVLVGTALAKSRLGRYSGHLVGALVGAAFLLNAVSTSVSSARSIEGRLQELNQSVSSFIEQVMVLGGRSHETSVFLLILGALVWGAGQFAAYAVFRRHRPLPAIALTGFMLVVNVSITVRDEYVHLVVFVSAALVLLVRLNLLEQAREWRSRGMRDVTDISSAFMRNGAVFVGVAIVAATTLAANASSAPLSRAWQTIDDDLLEAGYAINRFLGGVTGSARGPNILFTPSQTIRGVWESSPELVFTATTSDNEGRRWRGATYDSFDGNTWQQLDRQSQLVAPGAELLERTPERIDPDDRKEVEVTVVPADYGGDVIVAPESPFSADQQVELQVNGAEGPFVAAKLVYGIQPDVPYTVTAQVRNLRGPGALTANQLISAGRNYPAWVERYLQIRPGSIGELTRQTAARIAAGLPDGARTPYHVAVAVQDYLYSSGGFQYVTDVRGLCDGDIQLVDCFLQTKQGYCEYFATAMVMLLRELGVPARYVLGYLPGRQDDEDRWIVERSAAHAWVEVYFPGQGWVEFDPTPGNAENGQQPTQLEFREEDQPSPTPAAPEPEGCDEQSGELECEEELIGGPPIDPPRPVPSAPAATNDLAPLILGGGVVLTLLLLALWAALRRVPTTEPEIAYRSVTRLASRLGYGPRPAQTAYEWAASVGELVPVASSDLRLIATAKVEATYARRRPGETMLRSLALAYRRVRLGLLRLIIRRPKVGLGPRFLRTRRSDEKGS